MGPFFVPAIVTISLALIASFIVGVVLLGVSFLPLEGGKPRRQKLRLVAFLLLAWPLFELSVMFFDIVIVDGGKLDPQPREGEVWITALPDDYAMAMIETTDFADVYNPRTQPDPSHIVDRSDAVTRVSDLQISGLYILGIVADSYETMQPQRYFLLDTRAGTHRDFPRFKAFQEAADALGIELHLQPVGVIRAAYKFTWEDALDLALLLGPLPLGLWWLRRRLARLEGPETA